MQKVKLNWSSEQLEVLILIRDAKKKEKEKEIG